MNFSGFWRSDSAEKVNNNNDKNNNNNNNNSVIRKPSVIPPSSNIQSPLQSPFNKSAEPIRSSVKRPRATQSNVSVNQIANAFNNVSNVQPNKPKLYAPLNINNNNNGSTVTTNHPDLFIGNNLSGGSKSKTSSSSSSNNNNNNAKNVFLSSLVGNIEYSPEMEKVDDVLRILFKDDEPFMNKLHDFSIQMEGLVSVGDGKFWKSSSSGYESLIDTVKKFTERKFFPKTLSEPYVRPLSVDEQIYIGDMIRDEFIIRFDNMSQDDLKILFFDNDKNIILDRWIKNIIETTIVSINKQEGTVVTPSILSPLPPFTTSNTSSSSSSNSKSTLPTPLSPQYTKAAPFFGKKPQITTDRDFFEKLIDDVLYVIQFWRESKFEMKQKIVWKALKDGTLYQNVKNSQLVKISTPSQLIDVIRKKQSVEILTGPPQTKIQTVPQQRFKIDTTNMSKSNVQAREFNILKEEIDARIDQFFTNPKNKFFKLQIYDSKLKPPKIISLLEQYKNFAHTKKKAAILKDLSFSTDENILLTHLVQSQFVSAIKGGLLRSKYFSTLKEILDENSLIVTAFAELCASTYRFNAANSSRLTGTTRNTQIALALGDQIDMFNNISSSISSSQLKNSPFYQLDNNDNYLLLPGQSRNTKRRRLLGFSDNSTNNSFPQMIL